MDLLANDVVFLGCYHQRELFRNQLLHRQGGSLGLRSVQHQCHAVFGLVLVLGSECQSADGLEVVHVQSPVVLKVSFESHEVALKLLIV